MPDPKSAAAIAQELATAADNAPSFGGMKPAAQAVAGFAAAICEEVQERNASLSAEIERLEKVIMSSISNEGELLAKIAELEAKLGA